MNLKHEPPLHPDEDTSPSPVVTPQESEEWVNSPDAAVWGWMSLIGAAFLTFATVFLLLLPPVAPVSNQTSQQPPDQNPTSATSSGTVPEQVTLPTQAPQVVMLTDTSADQLPPPVSAQQLLSLLNTPITPDESMRVAFRYQPFTTINSSRPRTDFVEYTAAQGDTVDDIARRYGIKPESIAWCNNRRIIQVLRPGDVLTIPPVDGACHRVLGTREETITAIAAQYKVADAYSIIDFPYNYERLPAGINPDEILPGGTDLFIPNGIGEIITWRPPVSTETDASGQVIGLTFAPGQSGSCGRVSPGGGAYWTNPLPSGTWVRGFYAGHSGIDLAAPTGTPIYAANSGNVLFAGVSRWGYGNLVVLEHGAYISTLYGHMSAISVGCGQFVAAGQVVGLVGSTGNSSGPHLHFEIRSGDNPTDPTATAGIGW
jgi:murein DD-endopeptidase MepM/ murein hydrolase activator NlpD